MMGPLLWPLSTSHPCFSPCLPADCQNALGMASGYIADSQITASGQEGEFGVVVGAGSDSACTTQRWSKLDLSKSPPSMPRSGSPEETPEGASPLHQGRVTLLEAADPSGDGRCSGPILQVSSSPLPAPHPYALSLQVHGPLSWPGCTTPAPSMRGALVKATPGSR